MEKILNKLNQMAIPTRSVLIINDISSNKCPGGGALQLHLYGGVWPQDWKIDPSAD